MHEMPATVITRGGTAATPVYPTATYSKATEKRRKSESDRKRSGITDGGFKDEAGSYLFGAFKDQAGSYLFGALND